MIIIFFPNDRKHQKIKVSFESSLRSRGIWGETKKWGHCLCWQGHVGYHHLVNKIPLETKTTLLGLGFYYTEKHFFLWSSAFSGENGCSYFDKYLSVKTRENFWRTKSNGKVYMSIMFLSIIFRLVWAHFQIYIRWESFLFFGKTRKQKKKGKSAYEKRQTQTSSFVVLSSIFLLHHNRNHSSIGRTSTTKKKTYF